MDISLKKKELINWLQSIEDSSVLSQIEILRTKYSKTANKKFISIEDAKKASLSKIDKWEDK